MRRLALAITALIPLCTSFAPSPGPAPQGGSGDPDCPSPCIADAYGVNAGSWIILLNSALLIDGKADTLCNTCQDGACKARVECQFTGTGAWTVSGGPGGIAFGTGPTSYFARLTSECDDATPDYVVLTDLTPQTTTSVTLYCPCTP